MSLKNRALLVHLSISQWTGRKYDSKAAQTVELAHKTQGVVGTYSKQLLPGASELEAIQAQVRIMRQYDERYTLPWFSDGTRVLKAETFVEFTSGFRPLRDKLDTLVSDFIAIYPQLFAQAQNRLGDLFSGAEYPNVESLRSKFACDISFMPIPSSEDFRIELDPLVKSELESKVINAEKEAMRNASERLQKVLKIAVEKLQDPKAVFRDSLIENIIECCQILPKLNITGDPQLESFQHEVESILTRVSAESIRASSTTRTETVDRFKDIQDKMSAFMGGN